MRHKWMQFGMIVHALNGSLPNVLFKTISGDLKNIMYIYRYIFGMSYKYIYIIFYENLLQSDKIIGLRSFLKQAAWLKIERSNGEYRYCLPLKTILPRAKKCTASRLGRRLPSDWIKQDFPGSTRYRRFDMNPWTTESRYRKKNEASLIPSRVSIYISFFPFLSLFRSPPPRPFDANSQTRDPSGRSGRAHTPRRQKLVWKLLSVDLWYINFDISREISYFAWTIKRRLRSHLRRRRVLKFLFHALPRLPRDDCHHFLFYIFIMFLSIFVRGFCSQRIFVRNSNF